MFLGDVDHVMELQTRLQCEKCPLFFILYGKRNVNTSALACTLFPVRCVFTHNKALLVRGRRLCEIMTGQIGCCSVLRLNHLPWQ